MSEQTFIQIVDVDYSNPELLNYIENQDQLHQTEAVELGKQDGFKDKPKPEENLEPYREPIYRNYNLLGAEVHQRLRAGVHLRFGKLDIDETRAENQKLTLILDEYKAKLKLIPNTEVGFPWAVLGQFIIASLFTLLIWVGEVGFISQSLGLLGGGRLSNIFLALGISTTIMAIAHYTHKWTEQISNPKLKRMARASILLLIILIFYALGILRQSYFSQAELELPLWVFVAINVLFFLGFYLVAIYVLSPAVAKLKKALGELQTVGKVKQLKKLVQETQDQITANIKRLNDNNRLRLSVLSFAKATQGLIQRKYERAMSKYLQANLQVRDTPYNPPQGELPKLETYYQDINI